jgi:hypothetical protein
MLDLIRNINPKQEHINEYVHLPNGMVVHRYGILCTSYVDYQVWEPTSLRGSHHSTLTTIEGKWYGTITSRPLPPELEAMPGWKPGFWPVARIAAVQDWRAKNEAEAEEIIRSTFPQDFCEK